MSNPRDKRLYEMVKKRVYTSNPTHSAYRSGMLVSEYKKSFVRKYGKDTNPYIGDKPKDGLTRWFKEDWRNQRGEEGYKKKGDIYRPTKRITSKTPKTLGELSKTDITKAQKQKKKTGRVVKF